MRKSKRVVRFEVEERKRVQDIIREQYSGLLTEARERLCARCSYRLWCHLLPITAKGEDCLYFKELEEEK